MSSVDPYQTPVDDLIADEDAVGEIRFFSPSCRIGRIRYLAHIMLLTLGTYAVIIPIGIFSAAFYTMSWFLPVLGLLTVVFYIAGLVVYWIILIQRLHDLNKSGWMSLIMLIPLVNIAMAIYVIFWPGTQGTNDFGPPPPKNKLWHKILAAIFPILVLLGIVAAVALPAYQDYAARAAVGG